MAQQPPCDGSGYPNPALRSSGPWAFPPSMTALAKHWSKARSNPNGRHALPRTAMAFDRVDPVMMPSKRFSQPLAIKPNMSWMLTSKNASTGLIKQPSSPKSTPAPACTVNSRHGSKQVCLTRARYFRPTQGRCKGGISHRYAGRGGGDAGFRLSRLSDPTIPCRENQVGQRLPRTFARLQNAHHPQPHSDATACRDPAEDDRRPETRGARGTD